MRPLMIAGAVLTAFGLISLAFTGGIHYTGSEKLPVGGETQIVVKRERVISVPPLVACLAVAGGITLMVVAARR